MFRGARTARLRFRHRYEVGPDYLERLAKAGMVFSGRAPGRPVMQILELPDHPYFVGTQSHPEFTSRPLAPSPFYLGLVAAALGRRAVGPDRQPALARLGEPGGDARHRRAGVPEGPKVRKRKKAKR
jgi:hypothetical protein